MPKQQGFEGVHTQTHPKFMQCLRIVPGYAYSPPLCYPVPERILKVFLSERAALELDEETFERLSKLQGGANPRAQRGSEAWSQLVDHANEHMTPVQVVNKLSY